MKRSDMNLREIHPGDKFGRLTAVRIFNDPRPNARWLCNCECGHEKAVIASHLGRVTFSCGCLQKEKASAISRGRKGIPKPNQCTHGGSGTMLYKRWAGMISRCCNPNHSGYDNYGGRGITVCDRWRNDFSLFRDDVGNPPDNEMELGRIDNNGNYEPGNVEWQTKIVNGRNRRTTRLATAFGQTKCLSDWAEHFKIDRSVIWARLRQGWSMESAISTPINRKGFWKNRTSSIDNVRKFLAGEDIPLERAIAA